MATLNIEGLGLLLESLSVSKLSADVRDANVLINPLDVWRSTLATLLASLVKVEQSKAYKSIQLPSNASEGDLSVTLPRLSPGCKASELSSQLVNQVYYSLRMQRPVWIPLADHQASSQRIIRCSIFPY
jgi:arginyl-tRNA synthetase